MLYFDSAHTRGKRKAEDRTKRAEATAKANNEINNSNNG